MRISKARRKGMTWVTEGVQSTLTATAANTTQTLTLIADGTYSEPFTLVRLLLWIHLRNDADVVSIVFVRVFLQQYVDGAWVAEVPSAVSNIDGRMQTIFWMPCQLAGETGGVGSTFYGGTPYRNPDKGFHDIKVGRRIDPTRQRLSVALRSANAFEGTVNYRALVAT